MKQSECQDIDGGVDAARAIEVGVIEALVVKLSSSKKAEREAAEAAVRRLGPTAMPDLLAILVRERDKRKKTQRTTATLIVCLFVFFVAISIIGRFNLMGNIGTMIGPVMAGLLAATQTQRRVAMVLTELEDLRTVGVLAEALEYKDRKIEPLAEKALIKLLPRLKASDADLLDAHQRACLYRALSRKNMELVLAILKALEQVGDGDAMPYVQKLAEGHSAAKYAAQFCLPHLQQLAAEQKARQTLLRASSAADALTTAPDTLLRPASGVTAARPETLLRAAAAETPLPATPQITPTYPTRTTFVAQSEETTPTTQQLGQI